jgi:tricorn protease interacting factor F2/3
MIEKRETLGDNVVPIRYLMEFEPDMKTFRFEGSETIEVEVRRPTDTIALNAAELAVSFATVESGKAVQSAKVSFDKRHERVILKTKAKVRGKVSIAMRFSGVLNDKMYGFYRSRYLEGGKERHLLTTQFEPADARKAFPCFDEPALKAVFEVSLVVDKGLECVSNMPISKEAPAGKGKKRVSFLPTPKMSTYLVYLGVGNYDSVEGSLGKVKVRVLTVRGKRNLAHLALDYAKKSVRYYEDYFRMPYQLPKLDLLAIPDFAAGAMENWGAITFRETALLCDDNSTVASKQDVAYTIAHELTHQWFGDLVTMEWWDDLWLNESFATLMGYKAIGAVVPEWNMMTQYIEETIGTAFSADQLKSTHPINVSVNNPEEINSIFDSISYDKGGTVLHMIEDYVDPEVFRNGLHEYLKAHKYGNATKHDLWGAIGAAAKKAGNKSPIGKVVGYWIDTAGYPVVEVKREGNAYALKQTRFLISADSKAPSRWPIPIHYATGPEKVDSKLLMSSGTQRIITGRENAGWIKLNYGQKGLYRVRYEDALLERLGAAIRNREIGGTDAWGIESDLFSFARSGTIKAERYLDFVQKYCFNCGYPMDSAMLSHLSWLYCMLCGTRLSEMARKPLVAYSRHLLGRLGMERRKGESSEDTMLRGSVLLNLGIAGDSEIISKANGMFNKLVKEGVQIDSNLRGAVYRIAAWTGDANTFRTFESRYLKETAVEERLRLLGSLGMFRERPLIEKALAFALSKDVKYQDAIYVPGNASSNPFAGELQWGWTRDNWKKLMSRYSPGTHILRSFVSYLSSQKSAAVRKEMAAFFARKSNLREDIVPDLRRTLERIDTNIRFMKKNGI